MVHFTCQFVRALIVLFIKCHLLNVIKNVTLTKVHQLISPSDLDLLTSFDLESLNITLCNITSHGMVHQNISPLQCHLDIVKVS